MVFNISPWNHQQTGAKDQLKTGRLDFEQFLVWYASNGPAPRVVESERWFFDLGLSSQP
jgi:hypothetical protein